MKAKVQFWESVATLLDAGIPIRAALDHAATGTGGRMARAVRDLAAAAGQGRPLWEGMAHHPSAFRRFEVEVVRAAETSGTLAEAARRLAADEARADEVRGRVVTRLVYPLFLVHFLPVPLHVDALVRGNLLRFLGGWAGTLLPVWIAGAAVAAWVRAARGRAGAARSLLAIPVVGGILRDLAWLRWARAWTALEDAGLPADACALRAAGVVGYPHLAEALASPAGALASGSSRAEAFARTPLPADFLRALATGEMSGTVSESVGRAADILEHSVGQRTDRVLALLYPMLIVLVGAVVAWVAVGFYGGLYGGI